jgi:predicted GNAT superfamily acetyltransferase
MSAGGVGIRRVETQREYDECVRIEDEIWGPAFNERVPSTILRVSQYLGGVTAAAFAPADDRMLGFVFGITGVRGGNLVHWSDLLAVRPEARDRGLGRRLKLFQRSLVTPLGVSRMMWTFDPLVARNAHLNLNGLGASVTDYVPDMYGSDTGSSLHQAVGTDRFVVAWDLTREPGAPRDGAGPEHQPADSLVINPTGRDGTPAPARISDRLGEAYIVIPGDIQQLIATAPETARAWRDSTREAFLRCLGGGYRVSGFHRAGGLGFYHLTRSEG